MAAGSRVCVDKIEENSKVRESLMLLTDVYLSSFEEERAESVVVDPEGVEGVSTQVVMIESGRNLAASCVSLYMYQTYTHHTH